MPPALIVSARNIIIPSYGLALPRAPSLYGRSLLLPVLSVGRQRVGACAKPHLIHEWKTSRLAGSAKKAEPIPIHKKVLLCLERSCPEFSQTSKGSNNGRVEFRAYSLELQISYCVCPPKLRRKTVYGRKLCEYKRIDILEANTCIDHIHMCIKISPKYSVSQIMGYLRGKSSLMIFEQFSNKDK